MMDNQNNMKSQRFFVYTCIMFTFSYMIRCGQSTFYQDYSAKRIKPVARNSENPKSVAFMKNKKFLKFATWSYRQSGALEPHVSIFLLIVISVEPTVFKVGNFW
jgi:hypothetical protein